MAETLSPPPISENAPLAVEAATASAILNVPTAKASNSNTNMYEFQ